MYALRLTEMPILNSLAEPPVISEAVKENLASPLNFKAGDDVRLKVPVSGIPKPTAVWSFNGKPIPADGKNKF